MKPAGEMPLVVTGSMPNEYSSPLPVPPPSPNILEVTQEDTNYFPPIVADRMIQEYRDGQSQGMSVWWEPGQFDVNHISPGQDLYGATPPDDMQNNEHPLWTLVAGLGTLIVALAVVVRYGPLALCIEDGNSINQGMMMNQGAVDPYAIY